MKPLIEHMDTKSNITLIPNHKLRVALLLDNKHREYESLSYLQLTISKLLKCCVYVIGSIAEQQLIYHQLWTIKPHIVIMSQTTEDCVRNMANYIKNSGAKLFIVPAEITVMQSLSSLIVNEKLSYANLINGIFLPGKRLLSLYKKSDIPKTKLYVTGAPKIDVLVRELGNSFLNRTEFLKQTNIPSKKKNIFIFTSFVPINEEYLNKNSCFIHQKKLLLRTNVYLKETQKHYTETIEKLCKDFPECNIIHKKHPLEKKSIHIKNERNNFFSIEERNFYECLKSIDLAIHWSSTIATECWIKHIPTIQYVPLKSTKTLISEFSSANPIISSYKELKNAIYKYLHSPLEKGFIKKQHKFLKENYYLLDGNAATRISLLLKKEIKKPLQKLSYKRNFSIFIYVFFFLKFFFGKTISRKIYSLFNKNFQWKYAANNECNTLIKFSSQ